MSIGSINSCSKQRVIEAVKNARVAHRSWTKLNLDERIVFLRKIIKEFELCKEELILLEAREMGMTIKDASVDFDGSIEYAQWYCDHAAEYLSPVNSYSNHEEIHTIVRESIGVNAVIIPWNFPFTNFIWSVFQSLLAGNTIVIKHSEECPLTAKFISNIVNNHLPTATCTMLYGDRKVGKYLLTQEIDIVSFTGSTKVGVEIYKLAGEKHIRALTEMGGSAPGIIFDDADIDVAIDVICESRLFNQGQCCDGLKRLIVHESIYESVVENLSIKFSSKIIGDADNINTDIGPLVSQEQLRILVSQVEDAVKKGAHIETGGSSLEKELGGAFFEPTLITSVSKNMKVWTQEVFGPVLPVISFSSEEEAIKLANETMYGLGAYIFTSDSSKSEKICSKIASGMISVNGACYLQPCNPFGGCKKSGFGRQHGRYGFEEMTQVKVIASKK